MPVIPTPKISTQSIQTTFVASSKKVDATIYLFNLLRIEEVAKNVDVSSSQVDDDFLGSVLV